MTPDLFVPIVVGAIALLTALFALWNAPRHPCPGLAATSLGSVWLASFSMYSLGMIQVYNVAAVAHPDKVDELYGLGVIAAQRTLWVGAVVCLVVAAVHGAAMVRARTAKHVLVSPTAIGMWLLVGLTIAVPIGLAALPVTGERAFLQVQFSMIGVPWLAALSLIALLLGIVRGRRSR